jgi:hypothetical protein
MTPTMQLALGRLFRLMSRPSQPGDIEQYERCRAIVIAEADAAGWTWEDHHPNYARDHGKGA